MTHDNPPSTTVSTDSGTERAARQRFAIAEQRLLHAGDLGVDRIAVALADLAEGGADFADLYFETSKSESWRIEDEKVSSGAFSIDQGVGARAVSGDRTAFAYSSDMSPRALAAVVEAARGMRGRGVDGARSRVIPAFRQEARPHALYPALESIESLDAAAKVQMLQDIDRRARAVDPRIVRVTANLRANDTIVLVAASDGTLAADVRPLVQLQLSVIAEQGDKRARGSAGSGGRFSLEDFGDERIDRLVARATGMALVNLDARPAPAGVMPVVLGPGFPGVLFHEAVGHGLEGDAHRKQSSAFVGRMGGHIAAPGVTVIDDGGLPNRPGSLNVDDEGAPTERTVLIENGRLTGLMQDRMNARLMNQATSGNARRQSYAHLPMPRMTNTFLAPGDKDPAEIIASVSSGIYAVEFGGGTVDITSGQFNFSATQAYLIEDGRITAPIKGATLIGLGHEALRHISLIGDDLRLDEGEAICGKNGQQVCVSVGQPTIRIDEMVVGGGA